MQLCSRVLAYYAQSLELNPREQQENKNIKHGAGETAQCARALTPLTETCVKFTAPTWWLPSIYLQFQEI